MLYLKCGLTFAISFYNLTAGFTLNDTKERAV